MQTERNKFTFEVANSANKVEVKQGDRDAVLGQGCGGEHGDDAEAKRRRVFGRPGPHAGWKKAVVTLKDGEAIDIHSHVIPIAGRQGPIACQSKSLQANVRRSPQRVGARLQPPDQR